MKWLEGMTGQNEAIVSSGGVPGFLDDLDTPNKNIITVEEAFD